MSEQQQIQPVQSTQMNFRLSKELADRFKTYCTQQGLSSADGLEGLLRLLELNKAETSLPSRQAEINNFRKTSETLIKMYLHSLQMWTLADETAANNVQIEICKLNERIEKLGADLQQAKKENTDLGYQLEDAKNDIEGYQKKLADQSETIKQRDDTIANLKTSLAAYDKLQESLTAIGAKVADYDKVSETLVDTKSKLQDALATIDKLQSDAKHIRAEIVAELTEKHKAEVDALRDKLDTRTSELMEVQSELTRYKLGQTQTNTTDSTATANKDETATASTTKKTTRKKSPTKKEEA